MACGQQASQWGRDPAPSEGPGSLLRRLWLQQAHGKPAAAVQRACTASPGPAQPRRERRVWETCRASLVVSLGSLASEVGDQPISEDSGDSSAPQLRPTRGHSDHIRVANSPVRTCGRTPSSRRPWAPAQPCSRPAQGRRPGAWQPAAALPRRPTLRAGGGPWAPPAVEPGPPSTRQSLGWCCHDPRPVCAP